MSVSFSNLASILLHYTHMGRPLRHMPHAGTTFEITCRCIQGRMLLRPSEEPPNIFIYSQIVQLPTRGIHGIIYKPSFERTY
jgi:hypothetical protein